MKTTLYPQLIDSYESEGYENRPISQYEIRRRLEAHGNGWHLLNGTLFAGNSLNDENIEDTTDWTLFDLLAYLEY